MPLWSIPMVYTVVSLLMAIVLPRVELLLLPAYVEGLSVAAGLAFFSAVGSGMMALTGIVFAIAFVMIQFSSVAYSPRLAIVLGSDPVPFHTLGIFFATFTYSLAAALWTDRSGSGQVPLLSAMLVALLLIVSMVAFARLIHALGGLQIHNVLREIGQRGREVIDEMFPMRETDHDRLLDPEMLPPTQAVGQVVLYAGEPLAITRIDTAALLGLAIQYDAVIVSECGVGETLLNKMELLRIHGASAPVPEAALRAAFHTGMSRTFEQDPKYAIRLLVDIAIRALSPALNDPTTAVQALDQIEDLLRGLGQRRLDEGSFSDASGTLRVVIPVPSWEDYLSLAFDEVRQYGVTSLQVLRRLRSALAGLAGTVSTQERRDAVARYLIELDADVTEAIHDARDRLMALEEDRQGLGLSRKKRGVKTVAAGKAP